MQKRIKGFTLLEILLVIAAIGILAAIVLIAINPNKQLAQARNAERRSEVNTLYKALEQYLIDNQGYPVGITETEQDICINNNTTGCVNLGVLVPDYVAGIPKDPSGISYKIGIVDSRVRVRASEAELGSTIAISGSGGNVVTSTGPSDPYFENVSLLLNFDGANGGTTFTDSSSNNLSLTSFGNAQISTVQSRFGGSSLIINSSSSYLSDSMNNPVLLMDEDFTIEFWIYLLGLSDQIVLGSDSVENTQLFRVSYSGVGSLFFFFPNGQNFATNTNIISPNQWQHFAMTRSGSESKVFVNGQEVLSFINAPNFRIRKIGSIFGTIGNGSYIDDLRITKGVARYTNNFIPPTTELSN